MDGLNAMADRKTGAHQRSAQTSDDTIRSPKVGSTLPTPIQNQDLMSHQDGFSNNGTEPSGSGKSDDDDDRMEKKNENVAHPQDGIKLKKP